jgi:hypothetical protein
MLVTQHELHPTSPAVRRAVSTAFWDARIEARSEAVGRQATRATGRPNEAGEDIAHVPLTSAGSGRRRCALINVASDRTASAVKDRSRARGRTRS